MRYLFLTNTPAHVHLYKHVVSRLAAAGHEVQILAREYGCTVPLLEYHDLPFTVYGACDTSKTSLARNLPGQYLRLFRETRAYDPDVVFGTGAYAAHAGAFARAPVFLVLDSEPTSLDHLVSRPFARAILTPHAFEKDLGPNHYRFRGFEETAYLHPDVFSPDGGVREALGVGEREPFVVLRFNAFGSHHDVGRSGFTPTERRELITRLAGQTTVFVSDEGGDVPLAELPARRFDVHPARLHDALAEARLVVTDTQTVCTEAALLGTPVVRSNSFVGADDMGNFRELERAGLVYNTRDFEAVCSFADRAVTDDTVARSWQTRRDEYVTGLVNLSGVLEQVALAGQPQGVPELSREPAVAVGN